MKRERQIGFVGGGNMGEALVGALIKAGIAEPQNIWVSDVSGVRRNTLKTAYGIHVTDDNFYLFTTCDVVVLAIKPQVMAEILSGITGNAEYRVPERKLVISIAAGIPIAAIEKHLYSPLTVSEQQNLPIIRTMPNTPALVLAGVTGLSPNGQANPADVATARTILAATGKVLEFDEKDLDAVTALSGSGPAYVFYLAEAMIEAGIKTGLAPEAAVTLTQETIKGGAALMAASADSPAQLRARVASPGGTTAAALEVMTQGQVKENIVAAIEAAARRAKELSRSV